MLEVEGRKESEKARDIEVSILKESRERVREVKGGGEGQKGETKINCNDVRNG